MDGYFNTKETILGLIQNTVQAGKPMTVNEEATLLHIVATGRIRVSLVHEYPNP